MAKRTLPRGFRTTKFQTYFEGLDLKQQKQFGERVGKTSQAINVNYMRRHIRRHKDHMRFYKSTHAQPKSKTMLELARATKGHCNYEDMLDHFYRK